MPQDRDPESESNCWCVVTHNTESDAVLCVLWPTQRRIADAKWQELELVGFYLNEGLRTADALREDSIIAFGNHYSGVINAAQAGACCTL